MDGSLDVFLCGVGVGVADAILADLPLKFEFGAVIFDVDDTISVVGCVFDSISPGHVVVTVSLLALGVPNPADIIFSAEIFSLFIWFNNNGPYKNKLKIPPAFPV